MNVSFPELFGVNYFNLLSSFGVNDLNENRRVGLVSVKISLVAYFINAFTL